MDKLALINSIQDENETSEKYKAMHDIHDVYVKRNDIHFITPSKIRHEPAPISAEMKSDILLSLGDVNDFTLTTIKNR